MISTIATPRRIRIAGLAAGAVAVAGAAVFVTASAAGYNFSINPSSSHPPAQAALTTAPVEKTGSASAVCNDFLGHFSSDLGKSTTDVSNAFDKAVGQTLADEVRNGTITQDQANQITSRLTGKQPCTLASGLGAPKPGTGGGVYQQALIRAAASALGVSSQTLMADLAKGMTLHQVADAQNPPVTEAQFRTKLIANLTPLLDQAVTNGKLTKAQENKILTALQNGPIPLWDRPLKRPAATASPAA